MQPPETVPAQALAPSRARTPSTVTFGSPQFFFNRRRLRLGQNQAGSDRLGQDKLGQKKLGQNRQELACQLECIGSGCRLSAISYRAGIHLETCASP